MKETDTIENLIHRIDELIVERDITLKSIDDEFCTPDMKIKNDDYSEYKSKRNKYLDYFKKNMIDLTGKLDNLCKRIRQVQPALFSLGKENLNINKRFPNRVSIGEVRFNYQNLDIVVPNMSLFPIEYNMIISGEQQIHLIHKIFLRLMYSNPIGKLNLFVFDPNGLGKSITSFNKLISNELLFPTKKVITDLRLLKEELKHTIAYMENLYQKLFTGDITDWKKYNDNLNRIGQNKKFLPYKVFVLFDVPDGMDQECFDMFKKLLNHSKDCGILVIFSFNSVILKAEDTKLNSMTLELKKCIENTKPLHEIEHITERNIQTERLEVKFLGEKTPSSNTMRQLVNIYYDALENSETRKINFDDLINKNNLFTKNSVNELNIPIGFSDISGEIVSMSIGDETPHYLIGGTTGSGKSNLLHNIILISCSYYSPKELELYLLDFKDGVEFNKYINPIIPHAKLIATEADTEYGICVLRHLVDEKNRRYQLFKKYGCGSLKDLREKHPEFEIPRLMVIIDEFQVLFGNSDKMQTIEEMEKLAKQGRACGIHLILATQSLKGLDFGILGSQFSGRIALKCSSEDSKMLLGSISSNNEAASQLRIPYAIMNNAQGSPEANQKFAIPYIKLEELKSFVSLYYNNCNRKFEPIIFNGQALPKLPDNSVFSRCNKYEILIGKKLDYNSSDFYVRVGQSDACNILICGLNQRYQKEIYKSIVLSLTNSKNYNKIVCIGFTEIFKSEKIENYCSVIDFLNKYRTERFSDSFILLNEINFIKEFKVQPYGTPSEDLNSFLNISSIKNNNFLICFYSRLNMLKNSMPKDMQDIFRQRIGFGLSQNDATQFVENPSCFKEAVTSNRCFLAANGEVLSWFYPFSEDDE